VAVEAQPGGLCRSGHPRRGVWGRGHLGGHVKSPCCCPPGRFRSVVRYCCCCEYGFSRRHLHRLLARYREGGLEALEPRSRRPKATPIATSEDVRGRVIELRRRLTADGLDAGPVTIVWHLEQEGSAHRLRPRSGGSCIRPG